MHEKVLINIFYSTIFYPNVLFMKNLLAITENEIIKINFNCQFTNYFKKIHLIHFLLKMKQTNWLNKGFEFVLV